MAAGGRAVRGGAERDQGRGQRRQPPAPLGLAAGGVTVRQLRRPSDVRCHAGGGARCARRLPPLAAGQGPAARPRRRPAVVGSHGAAALRRRRAVVGRGARRRAHRLRFLQPAARRPRRRAPSTSAGSTPSRATARSAGRSAWPSAGPLARPAELVGPPGRHPHHGPRARPRLPQHARSPIARRCSAGCRWRSPRRPASSARRSSSRPGWRRLTRSGSARAARRRAAGGRSGRGRHPQPLPVRDRGVRPPPAPHARRRASSTS